MSFESATAYLKEKGFADRVLQFPVSSATVELAAEAVGCEPARIAKSLTFRTMDRPVMILCAGDVRIDNPKFKALFHTKASMLSPDEVSRYTGHEVGGVCPFGAGDGVGIYLDVSLKRFDIVYPACGDAASAVKLTPDELYDLSGAEAWINVCKPKEI